MRAFVALMLEPLAVDALASIADALRRSDRCPRARIAWTPATKMHLTLKFFADLDEARVPEVAGVLERLAAGRVRPRLTVKDVTGFPAPRRASVVVVELADREGNLEALAADAGARFEAMGVPREPRPFRGHVTLARTRTPVDARAWLSSVSPPGDEWAATEITLFQSRLSPGGSVYTARACVRFQI